MFQGTGFRGTILNKALHHQHERIYKYNSNTEFGTFSDGPGNDMTLQFLEMVHYDQGGRIFTYVITLDGMFRFTETGKEFGIDLLSKHTMHSDVNVSARRFRRLGLASVTAVDMLDRYTLLGVESFSYADLPDPVRKRMLLINNLIHQNLFPTVLQNLHLPKIPNIMNLSSTMIPGHIDPMVISYLYSKSF